MIPAVVPENGRTAILDPRLRLLLIAVRRALLILADALGDYCGCEKGVR